MSITEAGFKNQDGKFEPHITSKGHPRTDPVQAVALLSAIQHGKTEYLPLFTEGTRPPRCRWERLPRCRK
ncbi:MAG: hypothetical protein GX625_20195 [Clostridiaceae bacterium]|nr:hypothetical protein [Clostridiaceae bacterium]